MGPQERLNAYLSGVRERPFQWHVWDCFQFTTGAWHAMHGVGWADEWADRYTRGGLYLKRDALRLEFGFQTLEDAISSKLTRIDAVPPRGALVTTTAAQVWVIGAALGISLGLRAAFVGKTGLVTVPIDQISGAWI